MNDSDTKKLLLLSAYDGMSHRYWRRHLTQFLTGTGRYDVTTLTLPARFFSWRQRGSSLTFAYDMPPDETFDAVIATSMVDLSALRGLNRQMARLPVLVYFHENQFAYPDQHPQGLVERQLTTIYTALSADVVLFNSQFNRASFLEGAGELLRRMPDGVPPGLVASINAKSAVLPVALTPPAGGWRSARRQNPDDLLKIAWNHRWEHDKGPQQLKEIVSGLIQRDVPFRMRLFGERFSRHPPVFEEILSLLTKHGRLDPSDYIADRSTYLRTLSGYDVVLSTADHEFQGLAVQEAMSLGCVAVTPDRLSYPEYVPEALRYRTSVEAIDLLSQPLPPAKPDLEHYGWAAVGPGWLNRLEQLLTS